MGQKYIINGFNYPYLRSEMKDKQTKYLIVALWYLIIFICKFDGVDFNKRR